MHLFMIFFDCATILLTLATLILKERRHKKKDEKHRHKKEDKD